MNDRSFDLDTVQRWMQSVITHTGGIRAGIESKEARRHINVSPEEVESIISRSQANSSIERLAVYGNAYYARLLECMRNYFPALVHSLGEELFNRFALDYLQEYPSQTYTLNHLADRFTTFLEETRPQREASANQDSQSLDADWTDFVIDLSRLELTIDRVFDGPGAEDIEGLTIEKLKQISPADWPQARLIPSICLEVLEFRYPVNRYYSAFRNGEEAVFPQAEPSYVAITRRSYVVRRHELSQDQFDLLNALIAGTEVGMAITQVAEKTTNLDELAIGLEKWFHGWAADGFFQRVKLGE